MTDALMQLGPEMLRQPPRMPWNGSLSGERRVAWGEIPLDTIQRSASHSAAL
jgi:hypothetical protein